MDEHLADQLLIPMVLAGGGSFRTTKPSLHTTMNAGIIQRFLPVPIRLDQDGELAWRVPFRNSGRIHSRLRPQPQKVLCRNDGCVGLRCQRLSDHSADNASAIRSSSSPAVWGVNGLPFHLFVFTSESLDKGELHPAVAGGTAATIFAGGILGLEGISTPSVRPVASTFTCLPPTSMTRILLRLASLWPFATQFGRIGFVIAWYIISSLRNGGPYNSHPLLSFSLTFRASSSWVAASA